MKTYIPLLLLLTALHSVHGQCPSKGITTNPVAPVNPEPLPPGTPLIPANVSRLNTFDWTQPFYQVNAPNIGFSEGTILSAFYQSDNSIVSNLYGNKDNLPQDGWELIKHNLGYDRDGDVLETEPNFVYVVLYNKYTSTLRVMAMGNPTQYNGVRVALKFDGATSEYYSSLLSNASNLFALDRFRPDPELEAISGLINGQHWFYADFFVAYDPCACVYRSGLNIEIDLISEANVHLEGTLTGTITSISDGQGSTSGSKGLSFDKLSGTAKKAAKKYKSSQKFVEEQLSAFSISDDASQNSEGQNDKKKGLTLLQQVLQENDFLRSSFEGLPYVEAALSAVDLFIGGGKSSVQTIKVEPMAINATFLINGTIVKEDPYLSIHFDNPGAKDNHLLKLSADASGAQRYDLNRYPHYNEVLGVLNLLKTPKIYVERINSHNVIWDSGGEGGATYKYTGRLTFKMKGTDIEYVINEAANFKSSPELYAFVEVILENSYPSSYQGKNLFQGASDTLLLSPKVPLAALDELEMEVDHGSYEYFDQFGIPSTARVSKAKLHILANFEREDATEGTQNVLHAMAFPLEIVEAAPPQGWGNQFPQDHIEREVDLSGNLSEDVYAWDVVRITGDISNTTGQPITINAPQIIVADEANIEGEVIINSGWLNQFPDVPPVPENEVIAFCNSSVYKDARVYARPPAEPNGPVKTAKLTLTAAPNPFSTATELRYELPAAGRVELFVSDLMGQRVATLVDGRQAAGPQTATFRPQGARRGLYVATLRTDRGVGTRLIELR